MIKATEMIDASKRNQIGQPAASSMENTRQPLSNERSAHFNVMRGLEQSRTKRRLCIRSSRQQNQAVDFYPQILWINVCIHPGMITRKGLSDGDAVKSVKKAAIF